MAPPVLNIRNIIDFDHCIVNSSEMAERIFVIFVREFFSLSWLSVAKKIGTIELRAAQLEFFYST